MYRPPSPSSLVFNASFFNLLTDDDKKRFLMIAGDLNVDLKAGVYYNQENCLFDKLKSLHLLPMFDIPTRITNNSAKCLDHLMSTPYSLVFPVYIKPQFLTIFHFSFLYQLQIYLLRVILALYLEIHVRETLTYLDQR